MKKEKEKTQAFRRSVGKLADGLLQAVMKEAAETMPKWRRGTPPHKGWWLTRTTHADGHVSIACEAFQDDRWPHEGDDSVLYMDMEDLAAMQEAESLTDLEKKEVEQEGYWRGYDQAKRHYFDTFKDRRFEELLSLKISEWQASGDDPDVNEAELEGDAKLLKAAALRSVGRTYEDILSFCDRNYVKSLHGRYFALREFATELAEWLSGGQEGDGDGSDGQ